MQYYIKAFNKYFDFSGRARRMEYWMFVLFNTLAAIVALILDVLLDTSFPGQAIGWIYLAYALFSFFPGLAVAARRLQDTNRSGVMLLLAFIPIVGGIWLLVLFLMEGTPGPNQYGEDPKGRIEPGGISGQEGDPSILDFESGTAYDNSEPAILPANYVIVGLIAWMIFTRLFYLIIFRFIDIENDAEVYRIFNAVINFVWGIVPILLALALTKKTMRLVMLILGALYFLFVIWSTYEELKFWL